MLINLPYPPSVNHYWRHFRGHFCISAEGKMFRRRVQLEAMQHRKLEGKLAVSIDVYPPDNRRRDIDNLLKATLDSLQHGGLYEDDNQIDEINLRRCHVVKGGKLSITLTEKFRNEA